MRKTYRYVAVSGVLWVAIGALYVYFGLDDLVVTDPSTWELLTVFGVFLLLTGVGEVAWGVYKLRTRTRIGDEELESAIARVPIQGGEYVLTHDAVYHYQGQSASKTGAVAALRYVYRYNPPVALLTVAFFVVMLVAGLGMAVSGLVVELLPFRLFLSFLYAFLGAALLSLATVGGFAFWHWFTLRRRLAAAFGTANRTYDDAIPVAAIQSVAFGEHLGRPALYVEHRKSGEEAVQVAYLRVDASEQMETAASAFGSLDVPIRRLDERAPPEAAG